MKQLVFLGLVATMGCAAKVGVENRTIPTDSASTCAVQCESIGLELSAVALMAETIGCICQASAAEASEQSAAVSAGMATIMIQAAEEAQKQNRQHQHQHQSR